MNCIGPGNNRIILCFLILSILSAPAFADCPPAAKKDASSLVQKGLIAEAEGAVKDALLFYRSALNACPDLPGAHFRIGVIAYKEKSSDRLQTESGIEHLEAYLNSGDGKNAKDALRYLFHLSLESGNLKKATNAQERFGQLAPGDPFLLYARGRLAVNEKKADGIELLSKFIQDPKGDPIEKENAEKELIAFKYKGHADAFREARELYDVVEKGDREGRCGKVDECLSRIKKLLEPVVNANPDFNEAALLLGKTYSRLGAGKDFARAETYFRRAGENPEAQIELIKLYYASNRSDQALSLADAAARTHPNFGPAHYWRGCLLLEKGDEKQALKAFVKAYETEGQGELAVSILRKIQRIDPGFDQLSWVASESVIQKVRLGLRDLDGNPVPSGSDNLQSRYGKKVSSPHQPTLDAILNRILKKASLPPGEYEIAVLESDRVQALADGTGTKKQIYLTQGFLDFVRQSAPIDENNDVLAFAISHELAHMTLGHHRAAETLSSALPDSDAGEKIYSTVSRTQEFEADQKGLYFAFISGYNPSGALDFMDAFAKRFHEVPVGRDHPGFTRRSEEMIEYWKTAASPAYHHFQKGIKKIKEGNRLEAEGNPLAVESYLQAADHFKRFLGVFEHTKEGHNNLGYCHLKIALWAMAKEGRKTDPSPWRLSMAYDPNLFRFKEIGFRSPEAALDPDRQMKLAADQFDLALRLDPGYPEAFLNAGCLLVLQGKQQQARDHFDKGVKIKSVAARSFNNLGVLLAAEGNFKNAETRFESARRLDRELPETLYNLTVLYKETGRDELAQETSGTYMEAEKESSGWRAYLSNLIK